MGRLVSDHKAGRSSRQPIRSNGSDHAGKPIQHLFEYINKRFVKLQKTDPEKFNDMFNGYKSMAFTGEVLLGHLRYGTYGATA